MKITAHNMLAVHLVHNQQAIVFIADLCDALDFLKSPDTSAGIVRGAEQVNARMEALHLFFKQGKINVVGAVLVDKRI